MVKAYRSYLGPCWDETRLCSYDGVENETEVKKQGRLAMKGFISFANNMTLSSFVAMTPEVLKMTPLFCHYTNDVGYDDMHFPN